MMIKINHILEVVTRLGRRDRNRKKFKFKIFSHRVLQLEVLDLTSHTLAVSFSLSRYFFLAPEMRVVRMVVKSGVPLDLPHCFRLVIFWNIRHFNLTTD